MPRYVILRHETPADYERGPHWDFMLERDGVLWTWALSDEPRSGTVISAERLADHRVAYLDYEGPISGNRGTVSQVDAGEYRWISEESNRYVVELEGRSRVEIVHDENSSRWTFFLRALD